MSTAQKQIDANIPVGAPVATTARLDIDLGAIRQNYAALGARAEKAECAAVVKADAYGTGAEPVSRALYAAGCRHFFVATLQEAVNVRAILSDNAPAAAIYVLDGLLPGAEQIYEQHALTPVLGSLEALDDWTAFAKTQSRPLSTALHIDTGMNRLGLGPDALPQFLRNRQAYLHGLRLELVMSHLACADEPEHPQNRRQLELFRAALAQLPPVKASLANSAGIFLGPDYHFDLLRPGIALYGGRAVNNVKNPMRGVVCLTSNIAQVRRIKKGDGVGYGASFTAARDSLVATVPVGYADGYLRALGANGHGPTAQVCIGGHLAPLCGRVSMDLITIDVTDLPAGLAVVGAPVELIGPHVSVDDLADVAGTIGYEILTSLGRRYARRYLNAISKSSPKSSCGKS